MQGSQTLMQLEKRLPHPARQLQNISQGLDDINLRMQQAMKGLFARKRTDLLQICSEINHFNPLQLIRLNREKCQFLYEKLQNNLSHSMQTLATRMRHASHALHSVSPLATLERGYAIVTRIDSNNLIRDAGQLSEGETICTRLALGQVQSSVKKIMPDNK